MGTLDPLIAELADEVARGDVAEDAFAALALAVPAPGPPPRLRTRLLAALAHGRFEAFTAAAAQLLDVSLREARRFLDRVDREELWQPGPTPPSQWLELPVSEGVAGFLRLRRGHRFPRHRHLGCERMLVLQGSLKDDLGRILSRGQVAVVPEGSEHAFRARAGPDLVCLVTLEGEVVFPTG